jgi:hypothetical protein
VGHKLAILAIHIVEIAFFVGLAGCAVVVIWSWISVIKGCFTDKI